jgi:cathepsin B
MLGALVHSFWKTGPNVQTTDVNDAAFISERNNMGSSFSVTSMAMFDGYKLIDIKNLLNSQASNKQQLYLCNTGNKDTIVPESFNFREEFPDCARPIYSQGNCSSSYAIATVSAITDRWCKNNQLNYPILSPQGPLACDKAINKQCKGGYVSRTLDYAKIYGLVEEKCITYSSEPSTPEECQAATATCDKHKIDDYCVSKELETIKQEIFNHGPVITVIPVYRDFLIYEKGLYQVYPRNQKFSTGQALKIIGWDVRDGQTCWLVENSWGEDWGENGIAYIFIIIFIDVFWLTRMSYKSKNSLLLPSSTPRLSKEKRSINKRLM